MLYKLTAIFVFLTVSQFIQVVHAGESCVIYFNNFKNRCEFGWRDKLECEKAKDYMKKQLACSTGFGDGCYMALEGCNSDTVIQKAGYRCKDIGGKLVTDGRAGGVCDRNPDYNRI